MSEIDTISRARTLAVWAHEYQMYGLYHSGVPYIEHVGNVVTRGFINGSDEAREIVAWLHDVVEDTSITIDVIRTEFSTEVTEAVDAITRKSSERGYKVDYRHYILRLKENEIARFVKINDLMENISHCTKSEQASLLDRYERALVELVKEE